MRKVTQLVCGAFNQYEKARRGNTSTDGKSLRLFGNTIAENREDGLYITTAGWDTVTTRERLNGVRRVHVSKVRGQLLLNNMPWDGSWVKVT